ncbi:MAG TPA: hypothetical protein VJH03_13890 [Blastocatellia bacterium]|nr:hypothetical protein [Blastocatellia bacterium]
MGILQMLILVVWLGALVCAIIVLVKQFQIGGAVHGIIGIITCTIWAFIWGWINVGKANIKTIMLVWTGLIVVYFVLAIAGGGFTYSFGTP